jgi:hypothetical protein
MGAKELYDTYEVIDFHLTLRAVGVLTLTSSTVVLPKPDEAYDEIREIPGLQISLGWQYDRIKRSIPLCLASSFLAVSAVSLGTACWMAGTKDTGTALAFGQLVAALIALVIVIADR